MPSPWLTLQTEARALARRAGLKPLIRRIVPRTEDKFNEALKGAIRPGDTVWDVGANLGEYTVEFAEWVGPTGTVVAFEPVPSCVAEVRKASAGIDHVQLIDCGLGDVDAKLPMMVDDHPLAGTHSFAGTGTGTAIELQMRRADSLIGDGTAPAPNVVKIDVEGFEQEALQGFGSLLSQPDFRAILCEVHFTVLDERGRRQAPREIETLLKSSGFKTRWVDASHIVALRSGA